MPLGDPLLSGSFSLSQFGCSDKGSGGRVVWVSMLLGDRYRASVVSFTLCGKDC